MPVSQTEILEDRERRTQEVAAAKAVRDRAKAEKRELTAEEEAQIDAHLDEAERIRVKYEREERLRAEESALQERRIGLPREALERPIAGDGSLVDETFDEEKLLAEGERFLTERLGRTVTWGALQEAIEEGRPPQVLAQPWSRQQRLRATSAYTEAFFRSLMAPSHLTTRQRQLLGEVNADLQVDNDAQAGVLVMPLQTVSEVIAAADQLIAMRQFVTTIPVREARALGVRKRTSKASSYTRGSELATPTFDTSLKYGAKELHPSDWVSGLKFSRNLMFQSALSVESMFVNELMIDIREGKAAEYVSGAGGADSPLGVFVASADGISTARDVTAGSTTDVTIAGLKAVKWKSIRYWNQGLRWGGHPDLFEHIDKLETGATGELLWRTGLREGEPDRFLGVPVFYDESFPNTFTTGKYVGMLAAWSWYWVAVSIEMTVQRLVELYAESNQIGLIVRGKDDAMPVLEEPFTRATLA